MRNLSELKELGFHSLEDYLQSESLEYDPAFGSDISAGNGIITVKLPKEKSSFFTFYLLLTCSSVLNDDTQNGERLTPRHILLDGKKIENEISFDLNKGPRFLLETSEEWPCYIVMADSKSFSVSRLRTEGNPVGLIANKSAPVNSRSSIAGKVERFANRIFRKSRRKLPETSPSISRFELWSEADRLYDTGLRSNLDDRPQRLMLRANATNRRVTLISVSDAEAQVLLTGGLMHRKRTSAAQKKYPYLFSIVMAVYKVEDYIEEAIESVINQDIGFEKYVQLILVDDGSPDRSGDICDRYAKQYPNNIVVIHKENGGAASARNAGKAIASGEYVNFMDPDDKISTNTLSAVQAFCNGHGQQTDVVAVPLYFFEAASGPYWQNYKFEKGTRMIDLWREWKISDMNTAASYIRLELAQKFDFDPALPCGEDAKMLLLILMEKMKLGVVAEGVYWYRRRNAGGSQINGIQTKRSWYFEYFEHLVFEVFRYSKEKFGFIPEYVQNTIMMDLQWRFHVYDYPEGTLTEQEKQRYRSYFPDILRQIDDHIILKQQKLKLPQLIQVFNFKYQEKITPVYSADDIHFVINGQYIASCSRMLTYIDFISLDHNTMNLEGSTVLAGFPDHADIKIYLFVAGEYYLCQPVKRTFEDTNCFGKLKRQLAFRVSFPVRSKHYGKAIRIVTVVDDHPVFKRRYSYDRFTPFFGRLDDQYYCKNGYIIHGYKGCIKIEPATQERSVYEKQYITSLKELLLTEEEMKNHPILPSDLTPEKYEQIVRLRSFALSYEKKRPIWLVSDRIDRAGDNGEAFFIFLMKQHDLPADVYFVIDKDSPDYQRISAIGPVLAYGSEEHLRLHLVADMLISSQGEDSVFTPFNGMQREYSSRKYYADLLAEQKFVFLQHGIIMNNLSDWLNRYNKHIAGFITSTTRERQSILDDGYYYTEDQVWKTGLARFDLLYEDSQKQIIICPTWRKFLQNLPSTQFEQSEYYQFYSALLSDERLLRAIIQKGYHLSFRLHPSMMQFYDSFKCFDHVTLLDDSIPYRQIFAESNLMITDYSSVGMEFGYLRKPVIYCQFDREAFFGGGHTLSAGYFDYFKDGFGPVTKTVNETVDAVIELLERNCQMAPEYLKRANDFFPVNDYHNCERIYQRILELGGLA